MESRFSRTELLIGKTAVERLVASRVAIFGVGGVGGAVVEALARAGVGKITVIDGDVFSESNLNRQILSTVGNIGKSKAEIAKKRILDIDPEASVTVIDRFMTPEDMEAFPYADYDYIVDAIDSVRSKVTLIVSAKRAGVPIISAMGAGNKLDATAFRVADLSKTKVCPLARAIRVALRKHGISHHKVVYSEEIPTVNPDATVPGTVPYVPPVAGFILAGEVIKDLTAEKDETV